jgi:hypothetical protein
MVRHGYWKAGNNLIAQAKKYLYAVSRGVYSKNEMPIRVEENFNRFCFNSKQKIFFFIDNDPNEFGFVQRNGVEHKIRFVPYSSNPDVDSANIHPNTSFYNMKEIDFFQEGTTENWYFTENNVGYSLDYWNLNDNGVDIENINYQDPKKYNLFAMNIHLQMDKVTLPSPSHPPTPVTTPVGTPYQTYLPLILDPDTGNMGGTP